MDTLTWVKGSFTSTVNFVGTSVSETAHSVSSSVSETVHNVGTSVSETVSTVGNSVSETVYFVGNSASTSVSLASASVFSVGTLVLSSVKDAFPSGFSVESSCDSEDKSFEEMCKKVEQNSDEITSVIVGDECMTSERAKKLSSALLGNTHVNKIAIDFRYWAKIGSSVLSLLDFIEFSPCLSAVDLKNATLKDSASCTVILVVLLSMSKNPSIQDLTIESREAVYMDNLSAIWESTSAILETLLLVSKPNLAFLQTAIATALNQCIHLETLWLEELDEPFLVQSLGELSYLRALNCLTIIPKKNATVATFSAIESLLTTSGNLEQLELHSCIFTAQNLQVLIDGLNRNQRVNEISLHSCTFDRSSTSLVEGMFRCSNVQKLTLGKNICFYKSTWSVLAEILTSDCCSLLALDMQHRNTANDTVNLLKTLANEDVQEDGLYDVLTSFVSAELMVPEPDRDDTTDRSSREVSLESLSLGFVNTDDELEALKTTVPDMSGLRHISVCLSDKIANSKSDLRDAFSCNSGLEKCKINGQEFILKEKPKLRREVDRSSAMKRHQSLRNILSEDEIAQINAKADFLQIDDAEDTEATNEQDHFGSSIASNMFDDGTDEISAIIGFQESAKNGDQDPSSSNSANVSSRSLVEDTVRETPTRDVGSNRETDRVGTNPQDTPTPAHAREEVEKAEQVLKRIDDLEKKRTGKVSRSEEKRSSSRHLVTKESNSASKMERGPDKTLTKTDKQHRSQRKIRKKTATKENRALVDEENDKLKTKPHAENKDDAHDDQLNGHRHTAKRTENELFRSDPNYTKMTKLELANQRDVVSPAESDDSGLNLKIGEKIHRSKTKSESSHPFDNSTTTCSTGSPVENRNDNGND